MSKMSKSEKEQKMSYLQLRAEKDFIQQIKNKAGMVPVSRIIRELLRQWLSGEVEIDYTDSRD